MIVTREEYEANRNNYPTHILGRFWGTSPEMVGWLFGLHDEVQEIEIQAAVPMVGEATIIVSTSGDDVFEAALVKCLGEIVAEDLTPVGSIYHVKARRDMADMLIGLHARV